MTDLCGLIEGLYTNNWPLKFTYLLQLLFGSLSLLCMLILLILLCVWSVKIDGTRVLTISLIMAFSVANLGKVIYNIFTLQYCLFTLLFLILILGALLSCVYQLQALLLRPHDTLCYWFSYTFYDCHGKIIYTNKSIFSDSSTVQYRSTLHLHFFGNNVIGEIILFHKRYDS